MTSPGPGPGSASTFPRRAAVDWSVSQHGAGGWGLGLSYLARRRVGLTSNPRTESLFLSTLTSADAES